jgi:hypothetical protein
MVVIIVKRRRLRFVGEKEKYVNPYDRTWKEGLFCFVGF